MGEAWLDTFMKAMPDVLVSHSMMLVESYRTITGRDLLDHLQATAHNAVQVAMALYGAPFVVVSHGTQSDPVLNYGNRLALELWEMEWQEFTQTPSRFTAEQPQREERARLLEAVRAKGFIDDYAGVRISKSGRRFRIERATVWNVIDAAGERVGQAATFAHWKWIDSLE
jgi:predicted DNA-binding protein (UPF0251 family)